MCLLVVVLVVLYAVTTTMQRKATTMTQLQGCSAVQPQGNGMRPNLAAPCLAWQYAGCPPVEASTLVGVLHTFCGANGKLVGHSAIL